MHHIAQQLENVQRILLIGVGGLSFDVLQCFVEQGVMPNVGRILPLLAWAKLRQPFFSSPIASWATLETGRESSWHGVLDDFILDHPRQRLAISLPQTDGSQNLAKRISQCCKIEPQEIREISDAGNSALAIAFPAKPSDRHELECGLARTNQILEKCFAQVRAEYVSGKQRLIVLNLTVFDSLFLRLWDLLGIAKRSGGRRNWIAETQNVFRTLDEQLGTLFEIAARDHSAIMLISPYGFVPFREKIVLNELLRRKRLLHVAEGRTRFRYECLRFLRKHKKRLGFGISAGTSIGWIIAGRLASHAGVEPARRECGLRLSQHARTIWRRTAENACSTRRGRCRSARRAPGSPASH